MLGVGGKPAASIRRQSLVLMKIAPDFEEFFEDEFAVRWFFDPSPRRIIYPNDRPFRSADTCQRSPERPVHPIRQTSCSVRTP
ncbi:protein of unknown function [Pararobbsia alpina]